MYQKKSKMQQILNLVLINTVPQSNIRTDLCQNFPVCLYHCSHNWDSQCTHSFLWCVKSVCWMLLRRKAVISKHAVEFQWFPHPSHELMISTAFSLWLSSAYLPEHVTKMLAKWLHMKGNHGRSCMLLVSVI